jgi:hypothetical protein
VASEVITVAFQASDDLAVETVNVWGEGTGDPTLDEGWVFTCTEVICDVSWPVTLTQEISNSLTLVAVALDSAGQESELAQAFIFIRPPE